MLWRHIRQQALCAGPGSESAYFSALALDSSLSLPPTPTPPGLWAAESLKHGSSRNFTPWHRVPKTSRIQVLLTSTLILVQATITSHLDDYNGLLSDLPAPIVYSLQKSQTSHIKAHTLLLRFYSRFFPLRVSMLTNGLQALLYLHLVSLPSSHLLNLTSCHSLLTTSSCLRAFVQTVPVLRPLFSQVFQKHPHLL